MSTLTSTTPALDSATEVRSEELYQAMRWNVHLWTDRLFAMLMVLQWIACVVISLTVSPSTWIGTQQQVHGHVWAAIALGGLIASFPVALALLQPGRTITRHTIAAAQMLFGVLLIDLTGGRIETHFHIFGSLAFLAFYRDWSVLVTATVIVTIDHFARGTWWPESVFGVLSASPWRWIEHAGWVVFIDLFLLSSCVRSNREMLAMAHRQAQLEITKANVEQIVEQRTRQLEIAKLDAEAATRAKSEFLANMSHEIRTPMTAILGYGEMLQDPELAPSARLECVQTIRRNGQHLLSIVNDILDISKIEAGRMTIEPRRTSLIELVADLASTTRLRAAEKGLTFDLYYATPVPEYIVTDITRLRQILMNLLSNAVKFTQRGGVSFTIEFAPAAQAAGQNAGEAIIKFSVKDSGIGISPEQQRRLFAPFAQGDDSVTRRFGGTGLGLVISRRLSQLLGGDIIVASEPNRGSTFTVTIRCGGIELERLLINPSELEAASRRRTAPDHQKLAALPSLRCRILVAEDGLDNQRLLKHILTSAGAEVMIVENGRLACEEIQRAEREGTPFDLVFMDMQMPEMDGYTATRTLRAQGCTIPIVALTAHAIAGDRDRCLEAGCDEYLSKPVQRSVLLQTARQFGHAGDDMLEDNRFDTAPHAESHGTSGTNASNCTAAPLLSEFADEPDMAALIDAFLSELPERVRDIEYSFSQQNLAALATHAHKLKGAAGGYGYTPMTEAARALEAHVRAGADLPTVQAAIRELTNLCDRARAGRTMTRAA